MADLSSVEILFSFSGAAIKKYLKKIFSSRNLKGPGQFHSEEMDEIQARASRGLTLMRGTANLRFKK